jgi:Ca-activated chloride channel homolog
MDHNNYVVVYCMTIIPEIMLANPGMLWLTPLLIVAILLVGAQLYRRLQAYALLAPANNEKVVFPGLQRWRVWLKTILAVLGFIFLLLTLMQPRWGEKKEEVKHEGRELFIALDISRSMLAQDVQPTRLEAAKQKIKKLSVLLRSERVGLILFAGSAIVQCPLTTDWSAFNLFLHHVDAQTISEGTTAFDAAIRKALEAFKSGASGSHKILVMVTDGEDFSGNLAGIKKEAQEAGLSIVAVGVGTEQGAPVPVLDDHGAIVGHQKDEQGAPVISCLNAGILETLATDCGGIYISRTDDDRDITAIKEYVEKYEKEQLAVQTLDHLHERYYYLAALSFLCFLGEWLL